MPLMSDASSVFLGSQQVSRAYLGDQRVWPSGTLSPLWDETFDSGNGGWVRYNNQPARWSSTEKRIWQFSSDSPDWSGAGIGYLYLDGSVSCTLADINKKHKMFEISMDCSLLARYYGTAHEISSVENDFILEVLVDGVRYTLKYLFDDMTSGTNEELAAHKLLSDPITIPTDGTTMTLQVSTYWGIKGVVNNGSELADYIYAIDNVRLTDSVTGDLIEVME